MSRTVQPVQSNVQCYDTILPSDDEFYTPQSNPSYTHIPSIEAKPYQYTCGTARIQEYSPVRIPSHHSGTNLVPRIRDLYADRSSSHGSCASSPYKYVSAAGSEVSSSRISTPVNSRNDSRNVSFAADDCGLPTKSNSSRVSPTRVNGVGHGSPSRQNHMMGSPCSSGGGGSADSASRLDGVCQVTETIIKEKDLLIERQKLKRYQLEQRVCELEALVRKLTAANEQYTNRSISDVQLQTEEQRYKALSSTVRLMSEGNELSKALLAKSQLEYSLGELERELADLKCSELTTRSTYERKLNLLNSQIESYRERERLLEENQFDAEQKAENCVKELNHLKAYLADLPTKDEYNQTCQSSDDLKQQTQAQQETIDKLRTERNHGNREREELVSELAETRVQINQLLHEVSRLTQENESWIQSDVERRSANPDDIMALRTANGELVERIHEMQQGFSGRESELELKISDLDRHIAKLEEGLDDRDTHIEKLDVELEQTSKDYNELHSDYNELKEQCDDLERKLSSNKSNSAIVSTILSSETTQLQQTIVEKIVYAVNSLDSLMDMYNNKDEMDLPDLLSLKPTSVSIATPEDYLAALKTQSESINELNRKLESVHQQLIDRYADDMASSGHMECATQ